MGNKSTYITIINDTNHPWHCKLESKQEHDWKNIAIEVLNTLAKILVANQVVLSNRLVSTNYDIFNIPESALQPMFVRTSDGIIIPDKNTTLNVGLPLSESIATVLDQNGFNLLQKGKQIQYGPFTSSTQRIATCKQITVQRGAMINTIRMGVLRSGDSEGTTKPYAIRYWLDKKVEKEQIKVSSQAPPK